MLGATGRPLADGCRPRAPRRILFNIAPAREPPQPDDLAERRDRTRFPGRPHDERFRLTGTDNSTRACRRMIDELTAALMEIMKGARPRFARETAEAQMKSRALEALQMIAAVDQHPGTGQARRLVPLVAGLYNGHDYPFDLTELRALDADLASACLDYLNYDRLGHHDAPAPAPTGSASFTDGSHTRFLFPHPQAIDEGPKRKRHVPRNNCPADRGRAATTLEPLGTEIIEGPDPAEFSVAAPGLRARSGSR